jgi:hypothetical protein
MEVVTPQVGTHSQPHAYKADIYALCSNCVHLHFFQIFKIFHHKYVFTSKQKNNTFLE